MFARGTWLLAGPRVQAVKCRRRGRRVALRCVCELECGVFSTGWVAYVRSKPEEIKGGGGKAELIIVDIFQLLGDICKQPTQLIITSGRLGRRLIDYLTNSPLNTHRG